MKTAQQIAKEWSEQMNDPRIRCPNCGSTAQPELVYLDSTSNRKDKKDDYICGCGCRFTARFALIQTEILEIEAPYHQGAIFVGALSVLARRFSSE